MTPEPVILSPTATVADALARVRDPLLPVPLAAAVFICRPPLETPTGRYLGNVGIQRLLREMPSKPLGRCVDDDVEPVQVDISDREVAGQLARLRRRVAGGDRRRRPARRRGHDR